MNKDKSDKLEKFYDEYLNFISSDEQSKAFLIEQGLNPDALADEAIRKAKLVQMQLASRKTEKQYLDLQASLMQKVKDEVEKLLSDVSFDLENFMKQENINLAFRNFEKLSKKEVKELLERHYLLKFENELKEKTNP